MAVDIEHNSIHSFPLFSPWLNTQLYNNFWTPPFLSISLFSRIKRGRMDGFILPCNFHNPTNLGHLQRKWNVQTFSRSEIGQGHHPSLHQSPLFRFVCPSHVHVQGQHGMKCMHSQSDLSIVVTVEEETEGRSECAIYQPSTGSVFETMTTICKFFLYNRNRISKHTFFMKKEMEREYLCSHLTAWTLSIVPLTRSSVWHLFFCAFQGGNNCLKNIFSTVYNRQKSKKQPYAAKNGLCLFTTLFDLPHPSPIFHESLFLNLDYSCRRIEIRGR